MPSGSLQLSLNLPIAAIKTSLLTLTVAADDVALVVNRCPAEIISIEVTGMPGSLFSCRWCLPAGQVLPHQHGQSAPPVLMPACPPVGLPAGVHL